MLSERLQVYDCQVEKWAQKHADRCDFKHSRDRQNVGENIYKSTDTKSSSNRALSSRQTRN